jgi:hypothetical protein
MLEDFAFLRVLNKGRVGRFLIVMRMVVRLLEDNKT